MIPFLVDVVFVVPRYPKDPVPYARSGCQPSPRVSVDEEPAPLSSACW
ncbi:hypothetical protein ACR6C2_12105 [Streptomyces sp. INA 01156]